MNKIKQFLCGLFTGHNIVRYGDDIIYDEEKGDFVIEHRCSRCGKEFMLTFPF